jgi:hypothetical protein
LDTIFSSALSVGGSSAMGSPFLLRPSQEPRVAMAFEEFDCVENCRFSPIIARKMQR